MHFPCLIDAISDLGGPNLTPKRRAELDVKSWLKRAALRLEKLGDPEEGGFGTSH